MGVPIYVRESRPARPWDEGNEAPQPRPYLWHELYFTEHVREAMIERDIQPQTIYDIMLKPDIIEPNGGRLRFVGKGLAIVLGSKKHQYNNWPIITVLLREGKQWTNEDVRER